MDQTAHSIENPTEPNPFVQVPGSNQNVEQLFQRCMIEHLREGVILVDRQLRVTLWNRAAEELTGIRGAGMINNKWSPSQINLKDRYEKGIDDQHCPVTESIIKAEQTLISATVTGRGGRQIAIDLHSVPVIGHDMKVHGAAIFLRDLSSQVDLEQQVLTLYAHATRDQLTGVANRAHFERSLDARIKEFHAKGTICSLVVADIDFFKRINDEFGHHVGDHALMSFAKLLQQNTRVEDLVARYGGEEFVIICPNCQVENAVERAEDIRLALERTPMAVINGRCLSASFGVTEFQPNDSATSAFVRADQALLNAKENGRNQVQSLQSNPTQARGDEPAGTEAAHDTTPWKTLKGAVLRQIEGETNAPIGVLIEKIKGFVFDTEANIVFAEPDHLRIRVKKIPGLELKRFGDRHTPMLLDIEVKEITRSSQVDDSANPAALRVRISVRMVRSRDRRRRDLASRINLLMRDLLSHLSLDLINQENLNPTAGR